MAEVKIGGKYLWKPWCMKDGKHVPMDDDEDYGKTVTIVDIPSPLYPMVVRVMTKDGHDRFGREDDLEEIPHGKE